MTAVQAAERLAAEGLVAENDVIVVIGTSTGLKDVGVTAARLDDVPVIELDLKEGGRYQFQVTMYECSVEPCYFGLGVFYK